MLTPKSEADLAEVIAAATKPLQVQGGGTRPIGRSGPADLTTSGLSGVVLYEPGALTLVARAGTPVDEIETVLAAEGQRLAFEPMDHRVLLGTEGVPTMGGVVAANVSGPRRIQVGACRDFLLGVRFVDGAGQVLTNGGRVMKNVTGYDLVKLMAGSWGTLGVLTEVSLKVLAIPEAEATLVLEGQDPRSAVATLAAALGSPFDVTGAAYVSAEASGGTSRTLVRLEGLAGSVAYRSGRLQHDIVPGAERIEGGPSAALWRDIRDVRAFADRDGAVWRISVKPSDGPVLSDALRDAGLDHAALYDWGGGLVWALTTTGGDAGAALIRAQTARLGGHATLVRGSDPLKARVDVFEPQAPALAALSQGIKARFDPRGVLNPGLLAAA